eukprot:SAG31_NODE_4989_length_2817_cov_1.583517_3_plen_75_part_00
MRTFATDLATTLRRSGFEDLSTNELKSRLVKLDALHKAQGARNDPQITHTIADINAIKMVLAARFKAGDVSAAS